MLQIEVKDAVDHEDPLDLLVEAPGHVDHGRDVVPDVAVLVLERAGKSVGEQEGEREEVVARGKHLQMHMFLMRRFISHDSSILGF